jgi:hypothetical protein
MHRIGAKKLLSASGVLLCSVGVPLGAALAGPTLENTQETTIGTQATYDNNWAQGFQISGNASVNGTAGTIAPFLKVEGVQANLPNSGTAFISSSFRICQASCDSVEAGGAVKAPDESLAPYSKVEDSQATIPNSGTAVVNASVQTCQTFCEGVVKGNAKITSSGSSNSILLNSSSTNGITAITLETDKQLSSGFGAIITGDNIGTGSLQIQGIQRSITSNSLTVF